MPPSSPVPISQLLPRVGARVRELREAAGFTQAELARRSGVSLRFVADVERGAGNASLLRLGELALALGVSVGGLVAGAGPVIDDFAIFASLSGAERKRRLGPPREAIVLVGLRGAGKTTVGRALAGRMNAPFHEVDRLVEERAAMPLAALFSDHGTDRFRRLEREVIETLLASGGPMVLAAGGSIVTDASTWDALRQRTRTVWLRARAESHLRRVEAQGDSRPMRGRRDALAELRALLADREPLYGQADLTVDTDRLDLLETLWLLERWVADPGAVPERA